QAEPGARAEAPGVFLQSEVIRQRTNGEGAVERASRAFGRLLEGLMLVASAMVLVMTLLIGADVGLRNAARGGIAWSNEASEYMLYLITLLSAPWLLRQGKHIRIDIVLRALPPRIGWGLEWIGDLLGLLCSLYFVWYGMKVLVASYLAGSISIKTLILPEWW